MSGAQQNVSIGSILASLLFGIIGGVLAYKYMDYPLTYTDFITGSITWGGEGKSKDVSMIFGFMLVTSLSLFGISRFQGWIERQHGEKASNHFSIVLIYSTVPFVIWVGEQVLSKKIPSYDLLKFNAWIIIGGILATYISLKSYSKVEQRISATNLIIFSFLIFAFAALSPDVLGTILTRIGRGEGLSRKILMHAWYFIPILWVVGLYFIKYKTKYFQYSIVFFQLLIIGYFALLIPSPYITEGNIAFFPIKNSLYVVITVLMAFSVYDIYKRYKSHANTHELSSSLLSPFPLAALLILVFLSGTAMPNVNADDYHYGEKLLPFYMISKYHITPYVDYALAHGFIDMLPAIGSSLFLDGTASTLAEGNRILTALVVTVSFLIAYRYVGLLVAFLLSLLIIPIGVWYFIAIIMSLIIMNVKVERLGISFFLIGLMTFLLTPGQGAIFIVAMLPLVLYRAWNTNTISLNLKYSGISFVLLLVAAFAMPWVFDMIVAAVKYVLENGPVNFQAYGISWHRSWDSSKTINSSLEVYEVIRTSWAFVPIFVLVFWLQGYYKNKEKKKSFFYGLFAVIFILIMHKYSLGRIDPFGVSRLGAVSKIAVPILFLSVYFLSFSKQKFAYWALFFVLWMGLLTPTYLHSPINNAKLTMPNLGTLTKGNEINIPKLGNGITNEAHISRTLAIKKIADQFLNENETFVDVTNRGGLYFYLDRRMPIEAVPYNQPHPDMQQRSVDKLSKDPPPMALLKADNINHDGRSVSIRTHGLYRWVIDNYLPVEIDNIIIGVHKNELDRFHDRFPKAELQYSDGIISNITDRNSLKGISKIHAGFVVARSLENEEKYKVQDKVEFINGDIRTITNVTLDNTYMQIYLNGKQINGDTVGYPNEIKVFKGMRIESPNSLEEELALWAKVFSLKNLDRLPISWGSSQSTLDEKMEAIQNLDSSANVFNNVKLIATGKFQVTGKDPYVIYDVAKYNLSGKDAGLLSFDFKCKNQNTKPILEVYWSADNYSITEKTVVRFTAHNGHLIVPLDAMPRWITSKHIKKVRIDLQRQNSCNVFSLQNINLNQRALNAK